MFPLPFNGPGVPIPGQMVRQERTKASILSRLDSGAFIDITSGTFNLLFSAASTLRRGWYCWLRNGGTGDATLKANGGEAIDGLASYIMYPGEVRLAQCDGLTIRTCVAHGFSRTFTTSGTFTKPPGYAYFDGLAWSGSSSGQRTNNLAVLSVGGSGAGCSNFYLQSSAVGTTETITIGAGGLSVTTVAVGNIGGNTSFGSLLTVYAGLSALQGGSVRSGLLGAAPSIGGGVNAPCGYEGGASDTTASSSVWGGASPSNDASTNSGSSTFGGAAGGSVSAAGVIRTPGTSVFGGNAGAANTNTNGVDGTAPGGGGGATQTGTQSGAGARGELRLRGIV